MPPRKKEWSDELKLKISRIVRAGGTPEDVLAILEEPMTIKTVREHVQRFCGVRFRNSPKAHEGTSKLSCPAHTLKAMT